jgi:uncharacterized protein YraI
MIVCATVGWMFTFASPAIASVIATVASHTQLNVRSGPATWYARVSSLPPGATLTIECQVTGEFVGGGPIRSTNVWDRLSNGSYVSDAYLVRPDGLMTCGSGTPPPASTATVPGTVVSETLLNARTGPGRSYPSVRSIANGTGLTLVCQVSGQPVAGSVRATNAWDRLDDGNYVSDAYINRAGTPSACADAPGQNAWTHPLPGFWTAPHSFRPGHFGVDFMSYTGTPIRAASAGQVIEVVCNIQIGGTCDSPGSPASTGCGWYVKIAHAAGITTLYCHMVSRPPVAPGQQVSAGQVIGYIGSSGRSSWPHLHFEVHVGGLPTRSWNAVDPVPFMLRMGAPITH